MVEEIRPLWLVNSLCDLQTVKEREQSLVQCHGEKGLPDP